MSLFWFLIRWLIIDMISIGNYSPLHQKFGKKIVEPCQSHSVISFSFHSEYPQWQLFCSFYTVRAQLLLLETHCKADFCNGPSLYLMKLFCFIKFLFRFFKIYYWFKCLILSCNLLCDVQFTFFGSRFKMSAALEMAPPSPPIQTSCHFDEN